MKNVLILVLVIFLACCKNNSTVIEGSLTSDRYDNEWVYWVPFKYDSLKTVDSALIQKNAFKLLISDHNRDKIGIIRVRYQLRLALQDILVYTEPGIVHVHLDSLSRSTGTPLNDVLQNWKDRKHSYDTEIYDMRRKYRKADDSEKEKIKEQMEKASTAYKNDIYQIILENKNNEAGKFIYSINKRQFTDEQVKEIEDYSD